MKYLLFIITIVFAAVSAQAADVGVSVSVGQPGFYGRLNVGDFPQPALVFPRPVVIQPAPHYVVQEPMYLHVPPGHEKKWRKHCAKYNACGRPVYFVRHDWYNNVYVPRHREQHGGKQNWGQGEHNRGHVERNVEHGRGPDWGENQGHGGGHGRGR